MVKRLPAVRETGVRSLGQEDPLEKEMATHSSTLAWKIPWMEEPGRLQCMESQRVTFIEHNVKVKSEVAQSCPTLCDPIDGSPPGSSLRGVSQARMLE